MSDRDPRIVEDECYCCPVHGDVEGVLSMDGPLSNCAPTPVLCEKCDPFHTVIVGYDQGECP
jgi:hypothetical protein